MPKEIYVVRETAYYHSSNLFHLLSVQKSALLADVSENIRCVISYQ